VPLHPLQRRNQFLIRRQAIYNPSP
jgi:hypothetical protein